MIKMINIGGTEKPITGIVEDLPEFKDDTAFVKHITRQLFLDNLIGGQRGGRTLDLLIKSR